MFGGYAFGAGYFGQAPSGVSVVLFPPNIIVASQTINEPQRTQTVELAHTVGITRQLYSATFEGQEYTVTIIERIRSVTFEG